MIKYIDIVVPLSGKGGVETVISKFGDYLIKQDYRVRVVQMVFDGPFWLAENIPFYPLRREKVNDISDFEGMYATFLDETYIPDLVIATPWPYLAKVVAAVRRISPKPYKIISWLHAPLEIYDQYGCGGIDCLAEADKVWVLNERSRRLISSAGIETELVKNPVSKATEQWPAVNKENKRLLFVGRLSEEKRLDRVLEALANNQEWSMLIVGDGDEGQKLKILAEELGILERVEFMGWLANPWDVKQEISALVLSSEYEAFPLVAIEGLQRGIPVFSMPVDGIREIIVDGINGYIFRDSDDLSKLLDGYGGQNYPEIDWHECVKSVEAYGEDRVLCELTKHLDATIDKISVIIPCYNVENLVARCIDSVLNQTISGINLEIILVDDKSMDKTLDILLAYESKYPDQIIVIPLEENGKQGRARNIALEYASGNYVTYVDSDDAIDERMLERLYQGARLSDAEIVECGYKMIYKGTEQEVSPFDNAQLIDFNNIEHQKWYLLNRAWKTAPWGRMYRGDFLKDNKICFAEGLIMEDVLFSYRCLNYVNKYLLLPECYYFYYLNENGTMMSLNESNILDGVCVQNMAIDDIIRNGRFVESMEELEYAYFSKAFADPMWSMYENRELFSFEKYMEMKRNVLNRFPDIVANQYISESEQNEIVLARLLLAKEISTEEELYKAMNY